MEIKPSKEWFFGEVTPWEELGPGLKRQMMGYDKNIMLLKVSFEAGAVGATHSHYHSQVTYVVSGEFRMSIGEEVKIIKGGDSYYIPSDLPHGIECLKKGILIDVFSPAREDFLAGGEVSYFAKK